MHGGGGDGVNVKIIFNLTTLSLYSYDKPAFIQMMKKKSQDNVLQYSGPFFFASQ